MSFGNEGKYGNVGNEGKGQKVGMTGNVGFGRVGIRGICEIVGFCSVSNEGNVGIGKVGMTRSVSFGRIGEICWNYGFWQCWQ